MSPEQQIRDLAARISVIAEAPGVSFIPTGRRPAHEGKDPTTGTGAVLLEELRRRARRANGPTQQRELIEWANREIRARTHTPPKPVRSPRQIVLEDFEGHGYMEVAKVLGVHYTTVWRWRVAAQRNGVNGRPQTV